KGRADGIIILTLLTASGIFTVANRYRPLWYTGLGTLAVLAFTFTRFKLRLAELRDSVLGELADNPPPGLGRETLDRMQLQWGWAVLLLGAIFVVSAAIAAETRRWPENGMWVKLLGALSIPVTLVAAGLLTCLVPRGFSVIHDETALAEQGVQLKEE